MERSRSFLGGGRAPTLRVPLRLLVCCSGSKRSLMLSLVRQVYTWSPWHLHPSHLLCLSLSQAAAASRASGHSRPQPPSHIEHTPLSSPTPFFFCLFVLYCYILKMDRQRFGYTSSHTSSRGTRRARQSASTDTHFSLFT